MKVRELIISIVKATPFLEDEVKVDAGIPFPFENRFEFVRDKGHLLLKEKKNVSD